MRTEFPERTSGKNTGTENVNIQPYSFLNAERLRFGKFPLLDIVFNRWTRRIEETLFQTVRVEVYGGASVTEEMKFSQFFSMLKQPRPIYFFKLSPFSGNGLLVLDNRFAAFCLRQQAGETRVRVEARLSQSNQRRLQEVAQKLMVDFDLSWDKIHPVKSRLTKITTYPFRARILDPYENCLVAQIHISGRGVSSRIICCLPSKMLQPVINRLRNAKVIPSSGIEPSGEKGIEAADLLGRLRYGMNVRIGGVELTSLSESLKVGQIIPIESEAPNEALISLDGHPSLMASMGRVGEKIAFKIKGKFPPPARGHIVNPENFQETHWPTAISE